MVSGVCTRGLKVDERARILMHTTPLRPTPATNHGLHAGGWHRWIPLLRDFLNNATHLPPVPPPPPPPPVPQLPGRVASMAKCNASNPRMVWRVENVSGVSGGTVSPAANTSLCLDAGTLNHPIPPPLVLRTCTGAAQQRWRWNATLGHLMSVATPPVCLDDNVGGIGHLGLADCVGNNTVPNAKYQHFDLALQAGQGRISRSDGFCLVLVDNTASATSTVS
jgi:hypothetical protein